MFLFSRTLLFRRICGKGSSFQLYQFIIHSLQSDFQKRRIEALSSANRIFILGELFLSIENVSTSNTIRVYLLKLLCAVVKSRFKIMR